MPINLELIDIQSLSSILDSVAHITDLSFSMHDSNGLMVVPAKHEDKFSLQIKSFSAVREEHERFLQKGIERTLVRKDFAVIKGLANQHHLFIPVSFDGARLVFVSSPFYLSKQDFEDFLAQRGVQIGMLPSHASTWNTMITIKDLASVEKIATHARSLLETVLWTSYEKNLNSKRYHWTKTLIDVLYNIQLPSTMDEVYRLVVDAIIFLFNVDTVSVLIKGGNAYTTFISSGKARDEVATLKLDEDNPMIARALETFAFASTNDLMEISRFNLPDTITSMHIFPLSFSNINYGVMAVYNSVIPREEVYSILEFCKLASLVLNNLSLQHAYDGCIDDMSLLRAALTKLIPQLYSIDSLHETIVDTATDLLKAEKGSLLTPDNGALTIRAIKGINKWLAKDIKVKAGEGVAGRVYEQGKPLLSKDISRLDIPYFKPKSHYKTSSFISMPLQFASETVGVLNVTDKTSGESFSERDLQLLKYFASYASISMKVFSYYSLAEQMKELSITDHLTGLYNRRYLQERFTEEIHRSERYGLVFSFAMFDIDDFKLFNDTEGHIAGDAVLKELATITRDCLRTNDVLSRFGGEEFAVIMPQTGKEEAYMVAERIRKRTKEHFQSKWPKFPRTSLTVSIGIASFPESGREAEDLVRSADLALYEAKAVGKNKTILYREG